jgi:hypothetical protein
MEKHNIATGDRTVALLVVGPNRERPPSPLIANDERADAAVLIAMLDKTNLPTKFELIILAAGSGKAAFSSGMILRDTYAALGEPMSVTTVHRVLGTLAQKRLILEIGAMIDDVTGRPAVGYRVTGVGENVLKLSLHVVDTMESAA